MADIVLANTSTDLSAANILSAGADKTVTGLLTFDRDPSAPFAVSASSAKVTNLDADLLDGVDGASYATVTGTQVLTNKQVTPRVQAVTSAATVTPAPDTNDMVVVTAQAAAVDFANPTPVVNVVQGQKLIIRIKDNGTARAITFGTQYRALGTALPTTTVISKTLYLGLIYNSTDTKWDLVASAQAA
jgi:hypothetical protein